MNQSPHPYAIEASLAVEGQQLDVFVHLREGRSTIDDRRDVFGTLWFKDGTSALLRTMVDREQPILTTRDGEAFAITLSNVEMTGDEYAPARFVATPMQPDIESIDT